MVTRVTAPIRSTARPDARSTAPTSARPKASLAAPAGRETGDRSADSVASTADAAAGTHGVATDADTGVDAGAATMAAAAEASSPKSPARKRAPRGVVQVKAPARQVKRVGAASKTQAKTLAKTEASTRTKANLKALTDGGGGVGGAVGRAVTGTLGGALGGSLSGMVGGVVSGVVGEVAKGVAAANVNGAIKGVLGLSGERMSKVDTAWLRMDTQANLMMILGVWVLRPGVSYEALCERIGQRLVPIGRFRQRAVEDAAGATWVEDPLFDLQRHVVREVLPPGLTPRHALQQRVAELAMQPLDRGHPLWQFHLVEDHDGGSALIARIHHCIADGIALITVMMGLVDGGEVKQRPAAHPNDESGPQAWLGDTLVRPLAQWAVKALDAAGDGVARSIDLVTHPAQGVEKTLQTTMGVARVGAQVLRDMAALALMPDDSPTSLKGQPHAHKAVAWCDPIPLDEVKGIGRALGCSVNDVLLSCVAGALGAYLVQRGESVAGKEIRAMVPVNLRPLDQAWKLGNRFGLVPLVLPIGIDNPIERVFAVRQRMQALKGSTQPLLAFGLLSVAGLLVKPAQEAMLGLFSRKTSAVMTNVPGPAEKLQFCGSTLEQTMFWVPQSGDIGVGVSILSYGGGVQFGLITDTGMCAEPQAIIDQFGPQFDSLSWLALMLPWGDELPD